MDRGFTKKLFEMDGAVRIAGMNLTSLTVGGRRYEISSNDLSLKDDEGNGKRRFYGEVDAGGVHVEIEGTLFAQYDAIEWVVHLENRGAANTETIAQIGVADLSLAAEKTEKIAYAGIKGDDCSAESFLPFEHALAPNGAYRVTPQGGRSSCMAFPCFDLLDQEGGLIVAIGWSGQWLYELKRDERAVALNIGLEDACFYLKPGERVRLPRVLFKAFTGCAVNGHNDYRALLRAYFVPRTPEGELVELPSAIQCFDRYSYTMPYWNTEAGQKEYVDHAARVGNIDTVWLDAAWFTKGFPYGVGNYSFRDGFPNGLKPVSDRAHEKGMKFMVWFEPERIAYDTQMDKEHGEWVIRDPKAVGWGWVPAGQDASVVRPSGLLNLAREEVVDFLIEKLSQMIRDNGIDVFRQDFNIDPLPFWRMNDEPGRAGLTEIKYVTGFYRLWDALRANFPGMLIDNCASGGRRIDLETCMRSVPLWRSDTGCSPLSDDRPSDMWNQNQSLSLSRYLVFHSVASWNSDAYEFRSAATAGMAANFGVFDEGFDFDKAGACMAEFTRLKKYWIGDFYPMTPATLDETVWSAFQWHRADLDKGVLMVFRRANSPYETAVFNLRGLDGEARYRLMISDEAREITQIEVSGRALLDGYRFALTERRSSLAVEYEKMV